LRRIGEFAKNSMDFKKKFEFDKKGQIVKKTEDKNLKKTKEANLERNKRRI